MLMDKTMHWFVLSIPTGVGFFHQQHNFQYCLIYDHCLSLSSHLSSLKEKHLFDQGYFHHDSNVCYSCKRTYYCCDAPWTNHKGLVEGPGFIIILIFVAVEAAIARSTIRYQHHHSHKVKLHLPRFSTQLPLVSPLPTPYFRTGLRICTELRVGT